MNVIYGDKERLLRTEQWRESPSWCFSGGGVGRAEGRCQTVVSFHSIVPLIMVTEHGGPGAVIMG